VVAYNRRHIRSSFSLDTVAFTKSIQKTQTIWRNKVQLSLQNIQILTNKWSEKSNKKLFKTQRLWIFQILLRSPSFFHLLSNYVRIYFSFQIKQKCQKLYVFKRCYKPSLLCQIIYHLIKKYKDDKPLWIRFWDRW